MDYSDPNIDALIRSLAKAFANAGRGLTELAQQLTALQQCKAAGIEFDELANILSKIADEAQHYHNKPDYINRELSFEAQLRATGWDRKMFALDWLEQDCTDEQLDLYNVRLQRN